MFLIYIPDFILFIWISGRDSNGVIKYIFGFSSEHDLKQKDCKLDWSEKGDVEW